MIEQIKRPSYPWDHHRKTPTSVPTGEQIAAYEAELPALQVAFEAYKDSLNDAHTAVMSNARKLTSEARILNYIRRNTAPRIATSPKDSLGELKRWIAGIKEQEAKAEKKKADDEATLLLATEAIAWLDAKGYKPGTDFQPSAAVTFANDIAFQEEAERLSAELKASGGFVDFSGSNCEPDEGACPGWNGNDRRCECGNRRVSWTAAYGHSFKEPSIYAEAY